MLINLIIMPIPIKKIIFVNYKLMKINKSKITYILCGASFWYYLGTHDRKHLKKIWYVKGLNVSQKFKPYPAWDLYAEPFIINQFSILFAIGNSFIKGMTSDNSTGVSSNIDTYVKNIEEELEIFNE